MSASAEPGSFLIHCPAKVNLFLSVGPPDESGYHPVETILQTVGIFDTLHASPSPSGQHIVEFSDPQIPEQNTVTRALDLLQGSGIHMPPLRVVIQKRIPQKSGLGGGSSNAAAILRIAKDLAQTDLPQTKLDELAAKVGVDVPFFLHGGQARGTRYGEVVQDLPDPEPFMLVIAKPEIGSDTTATYAKLDALNLQLRSPADESDFGHNDFERVAPCESLELIERLLALGASKAALTGSGSAVYGIFDQRDSEADAAAAKLREEGLEFAVAVPTVPRKDSLWTLSS